MGEKKTIINIPEINSNIFIFMMKPDIFHKPTLVSGAAHDILLGLGDVLSGKNNSDFYTSSFGSRITDWAIDKWPHIKDIDDGVRSNLTMRLESLRADFTLNDGFINLEDFIYATFSASGYSILTEVECTFSEKWIRRLYPYLNKPTTYLEEQENQRIIDAMVNQKMKFLFLEGTVGYDFVQVFRFFLRKTLRDYTLDIINRAESLAHIPEPGEEEEMTLELLRDYFRQEGPK